MGERPVSQIIVNIPDCATGSHDDHDVITINTENCPAALPGPPPLIGAGEILATVLVSLAVIVGTVVVRYKAHELKPAKLEQRRLARKQEIDGQVALAQTHKQCPTCGDKYEPAPLK